MTINHNHFLNLAFQLAEKNLGQTGTNPSVGFSSSSLDIEAEKVPSHSST